MAESTILAPRSRCRNLAVPARHLVRVLWLAPTLLSTTMPLGAQGVDPPEGSPPLISLALQVHDMPAMIGFYGDLLGITFEPAPFQGVEVMESRTGAFVLRFAALREDQDFDDFPVHQPGFAVDDVARAIRLAEEHGGAVEGEPVRSDGEIVLAALRDPDGNTLEVVRRRR